MNIKEFAENMLKNKFHEVKKFSFGTISAEEVEMLKNATGFDLTGYQRTIDNYDILHIFNNHGNVKTELKRGQIAITLEDLEKIPEITAKPDKIEFGEKNKIGNELIKYSKTFDEDIFYFEEKRAGKKELSGKTMYKRKKKKDVS
jgi:hypothetical protein